jgi:hypothetical protein
MANKQLTNLTALTSVASGDEFLVNDVSAGGELKKITQDNLLAINFPAASIDSELALFSGTGGKILKRASASGIAKVTSGVLSAVTAPSGTLIGDTDVQTMSNKTLTAPVINTPTIRVWDGWNQVSDTWTYASANTITVPSGAASLYQKGDKIKITQTTPRYFVITAVTDTLLTVYAGSDYTVANAAITSPAVSHEATPMLFPDYFSYTPTGIAATNVTLTGRYRTSGRQCFARIKATFSGAITFTTMPSLPITASSAIIGGTAATSSSGVGSYLDNGTANAPAGLVPSVVASATVVNVAQASNGTAISATVPITWAVNDTFTLDFQYEF